MPFRAKVKRVLGGGSASASDYDPSNPTTHSLAKKSKKHKREYPDNVYQPGEPMPRPKYRGPYNQAHQDKLSAFSFGDAWKSRKNSTGTEKSVKAGSEYSPMGSRLPSRGPSRRASVWSTISGKLGGWKGFGERQGSHSGYDGYGGGGMTVDEKGEGEEDIMNGVLGPSDQETVIHSPPPPPPKDCYTTKNGPTVNKGMENGYINGGHAGHFGLDLVDTRKTVTEKQPFTADELTNAMSQSTLKPSRE
ncbi:MAG: hypothetical protein Q9163_004635 [Psora crenata]